MRQKLPESAGYALLVNDIGKTVSPGEEFDAPLLVPGCESLEPPESTPEDGTGNDEGGGGEGAQGAAEPDSKPRAKGTRP